MTGQLRNRVFVVSLALFTGGALACAAAILDAFLPNGSWVVFLTTLGGLGVLVTALVAGFAWACEKWGGSGEARIDALLARGKRAASAPGGPRVPREEVARGGSGVSPVLGRGAGEMPVPPGRVASQGVWTLRGPAGPAGSPAATSTQRYWHGQ